MRPFYWSMTMATICCWVVIPAHADTGSLGLIGTQFTSSGTSSYIGLIQPVAGGRIGRGWFVRPWLSYNTYHYKGSPGVVHGRAPGFALGLGYAWSYQSSYISGSLAPGAQDTRLAPSDPNNPNHGLQGLVRIQLQYGHNFNENWSSAIIANYDIGPSEYWSRLRVGYTPHGRIIVGPSLVYQGGPAYRGHQLGLYVDWHTTSRLTVGVSGGYLQFSGVAGQGYANINAAISF